MRHLLAITLLASGLLSAQSTVKHGQRPMGGNYRFRSRKRVGNKNT